MIVLIATAEPATPPSETACCICSCDNSAFEQKADEPWPDYLPGERSREAAEDRRDMRLNGRPPVRIEFVPRLHRVFARRSAPRWSAKRWRAKT
jgi:hypothetical protein